jgi:hypothetical protein
MFCRPKKDKFCLFVCLLLFVFCSTGVEFWAVVLAKAGVLYLSHSTSPKEDILNKLMPKHFKI